MDVAAPDAILFDDTAIQVLWHAGEPGPGGCALITFGDLDRFADGQRFFADTAVRKAGLACVGVMAKAANWFPADSMLAAADVILAVVGQYRQRVLYGGSMGGYAAIRYSRLLGATQVIALCPQWSLDPAECDGEASEWQSWFTPAMARMGVRAEDVAGDVFVFADMTDTQERWQATRLAERCADLAVINVPSVGHHVTSVFAGTQNLVDLLEACRARDLPRLRAMVREWRRDHRLRRQGLVERAGVAHGGFIFPAILRAAMRNRDWAIQEWRHLFLAAAWLHARGNAMAARTLLQGAIPHMADPWRQLQACAQLGTIEGSRVAVRTRHDTFLAYDMALDCCVHAAASEGRALLPLMVEALHPAIGLSVSLAGARFRLAVGRTGLMRVAPVAHRGRSRFEVLATGAGWFALAAEGAFLSAEPNGRLVSDRRAADAWEHFRFDNLGG